MKVLFFSPFSNVWEHSFPEALIAEGLVKQGAEVVVVRCGGMLDAHCVAMASVGVGPTDSLAKKKQVCRACIKRRDLLDTTMPFRSLIMDDLVEARDRAAADAAVAAATPETWSSVLVDGAPLGRYAAYEFLLRNKLSGTVIPQELWGTYADQLRNTVLVHQVAQRIIAAEQPTHVVVFNRLYSANHAFCVAASELGIPTFTLQGGDHIAKRAETMTMYRDSQSLSNVFRTKAWKKYRSQPIGTDEVALVGEHFTGLLEGSSAFAYSSAFEASEPDVLRQRFAVSPEKKVLLVPLSSEDEINAARLVDSLPQAGTRVSVFAGQLDWIRFVLDYAAQRPDLHFIFRLHPRMFPNKRENVRAPIVDELMAMFAGAPANVSVNLPTDQVSLYDLMQIVDVLLNYSSSVGAELAALGIPVVVPANADFFTYPDEINLTGESRTDYVEKIERALATGWSVENMRVAFRWYAFLFTRVAVDFSDSVRARPINIRPKNPGLRLWLWRKLVYAVIQFGPLIRERLALRNRRFSITSQELFLDALQENLDSLAESRLWPPIVSTQAEETKLLTTYLNDLSSTLWKEIPTGDSLTGHIRAYVGA